MDQDATRERMHFFSTMQRGKDAKDEDEATDQNAPRIKMQQG